jgi:hypothetical protein
MNPPLVTAAAEFTATGTVVVSTNPAQAIPTKYALEVIGLNAAGEVVAPTGWDVLLLGSLTGKTFTEKSKIVEHVNSSQDNGDVVWSGANFYPARYWALKCKTLSLGTAVKILVNVVAVK